VGETLASDVIKAAIPKVGVPKKKGIVSISRISSISTGTAKFPYGVFFLLSFFFAPALPKKKRTIVYQ
jgi:hypothetical protein